MKLFISLLLLWACAACVTTDSYKVRSPSGLFLPYTMYEGSGQIRPIVGESIHFLLEFKGTEAEKSAWLVLRDAKSQVVFSAKSLKEEIWTDEEGKSPVGSALGTSEPTQTQATLNRASQALAALFLLREEQVENRWHTFLRVEDKPVEIHVKENPPSQQIHLSHSDFLISLELKPEAF